MNPYAHETIARQWEAEAMHHEDEARKCRLEASRSRLMVNYAQIVSHVAALKLGDRKNG